MDVLREFKLEFVVDYQKICLNVLLNCFVVVASRLYFNFASFNADCVKKHNAKHFLMHIIKNDIEGETISI